MPRNSATPVLVTNPWAAPSFAPAYRQGDAKLGAIVGAALDALIQAEACGVTQANAAAMRHNSDPQTRRF
jgi:hypothetical protein